MRPQSGRSCVGRRIDADRANGHAGRFVVLAVTSLIAMHASPAVAMKRTVHWFGLYSGPTGAATATSMAMSPDGGSIFVTGHTGDVFASDGDFATVAYRSEDGARLWNSIWDGPAHGFDRPVAIAVSPDGNWVYLAGSSAEDFALVAFDALTGAESWAYLGSAGGATGLTVAPDGSAVF